MKITYDSMYFTIRMILCYLQSSEMCKAVQRGKPSLTKDLSLKKHATLGESDTIELVYFCAYKTHRLFTETVIETH